ncbi:MAG: LPS export ABC transporter permease LptF [Paracoccaceae bacterium]
MAPGGAGTEVTRLDRYVLWQVLALFGFFALVLVSVYWVNRAVRLFDQLIADGQSAWVFLEFTALALPPIVRVVLPLAAFIATVYATNRLASESELTVMQAGGLSPWRLAVPVVVFGLIVAAMVALLTNLLEPMSSRKLDARRGEVAADQTSQFLVEGTFVHPAAGLTLYIREIADGGELRDVFLADGRSPAGATTYTARRAAVARSDSGPKLLMFEGMAQTHDAGSGRLSVTRFAEFSFDIGELIRASEGPGVTADHLPTFTLLTASAATERLTGQPRAILQAEGHGRLAQPLLALAGALLGFGALLTGTYSRFGLWRQIAAGVAALVGVQFLWNYASTLARQAEGNWPVLYLAPLSGIALAAAMLAASSARRRPRAARAEAPA